MRQKVTNLLVKNEEEILKNEFGNYLIQEAYENFGESELRSLSEFIFIRFKPLSR